MTILSKQYPMDLGTGTIEQVNQSAAKIDNEFTAIYGHLNNIRVRYRSATAPTNPEAGQQWEDTVNAKVMKWNGSAWVEDIAKSLNLTNRNTVLQGQVSSVGALELILGSTSALTADLVSSAIDTIITIPAGHDATKGNTDYIVSFSATQTDFWTSLPANNTSYLFVDYSAGTVTGVYSVIAPVYQAFAPSHSAGLNWYDTNKEQWYLSDGSNWVAKYRCYVGNVVTDGTKVTATTIETYNINRLTAAKATILATARKINGVDFNGSADITVAVADATKLPLSGGLMEGVLYTKRTTGSIATGDWAPSIHVASATSTDAAYITINKLGSYAINFGLDTDGQLKIGGQTAGPVAHKIWHDGNTAGVVKNIQSTTKTDTFSGTSTNWADIPGLAVTITPSSAASKVLVTASVCAHGEQQNVLARLMRDVTPIAVSTGQTNNATFHFNDSEETPTSSIMFLDAPASAVAVTYKAQYKCPSGGAFYLNSQGDKGMTSAITVQEVAG